MKKKESKEARFFYVPNLGREGLLPPEEARHALNVLRLSVGDELMLTDGRGRLCRARLSEVGRGEAHYVAEPPEEQPCSHCGRLTLCVAPTKNRERLEDLVDKLTEVGFDALRLIDTELTLRHEVNTERLERVARSALKQSQGARLLSVGRLEPLQAVLNNPPAGQRLIAHCHESAGATGNNSAKPFLLDVLRAEGDATLLIGPEGDFSTAEVERAQVAGFVPVSLGSLRLRTETAAFVAAYQMLLSHRRRMAPTSPKAVTPQDTAS